MSKNENNTYNYFGMEWMESKKKPYKGYKGKRWDYTYTSEAGTYMVRKRKEGIKKIGTILKRLAERYRETGRAQTIADTGLQYSVSFKQGRFWRECVQENVTVNDVFGDLLWLKKVKAFGYEWGIYMEQNGKYCMDGVAGRILFNRFEVFQSVKKLLREAVRYYRHTGGKLELEAGWTDRKCGWVR